MALDEDYAAIKRKITFRLYELLTKDAEQACPRDAAIDKDADSLVSRLAGEEKINVDGIDFNFIKADKSLSEICLQPNMSNFGEYLKNSPYRNAVLVVRADCTNMTKDSNYCFLAEMHENQGSALYKEISKERNILSFFVFSSEDYSIHKDSRGKATIRPILL